MFYSKIMFSTLVKSPSIIALSTLLSPIFVPQTQLHANSTGNSQRI